MPLHCKFCHRDWKLKAEYDKHLTCCEFFYYFRRNQNEMDEFGCKIPNQKELFRFVQELANKCDRLEKEVVKLRASMSIKQKKSILDCLNNPAQTPSQTFQEWWRSFTVEERHLQIVFGRDAELGNGIRCVLDERLDNTDVLPIRAFVQKPNTFYIYVGLTPHDEAASPWRIMTNADMELCLMHLSQLFLIEFLKWQRAHAAELRSDTNVMEDKELMYMMKINGGKVSMDKRVTDIKKWLYTKIKMNITDMEYV